MKRIFSMVTIAAITLMACSKSNTTTSQNFTPTCTTTKTFAADARPVFTTSCATAVGCHAAGSASGPGELTTYTQIFNARSAIRSSVANGSMPPGGGLSNDQKNAILCWIDRGAPND